MAERVRDLIGKKSGELPTRLGDQVGFALEPKWVTEINRAADPAVWSCTIGAVRRNVVASSPGGTYDLPLRTAVESMYEQLFMRRPDFVFSGFDDHLREGYKAAIEKREPNTDALEREVLERIIALPSWSPLKGVLGRAILDSSYGKDFE